MCSHRNWHLVRCHYISLQRTPRQVLLAGAVTPTAATDYHTDRCYQLTPCSWHLCQWYFVTIDGEALSIFFASALLNLSSGANSSHLIIYWHLTSGSSKALPDHILLVWTSCWTVLPSLIWFCQLYICYQYQILFMKLFLFCGKLCSFFCWLVIVLITGIYIYIQ